MKQVKNKNAVRSVTGVFTRNFGLKLLSLVLALVIYGILCPEPGTEPQAILPMVKPPEIQIVKPKAATNQVAKVQAAATNQVAKVQAAATNHVARVQAAAATAANKVAKIEAGAAANTTTNKTNGATAAGEGISR